MRKLAPLLGVIALIGGATSFLYWAWNEFSVLYQASDSTTRAAILGLFGAFVAALFTFMRERAKSRAEAHRAKKVEIYSRFIKVLFSFFVQDKKDAIGPSSDMLLEGPQVLAMLLEIKRDMLLWSSPAVINAFSAYFATLQTASVLEQSRKLTACVKAIRKDLDLSNFGLDNDFFVAWVIQDPKELAKFREITKNPKRDIK